MLTNIKNISVCFLIALTFFGADAQCWKWYGTFGAHSVVLTASGSYYSWGWNFGGQLGDGTIIDRYTRTRFDTISNWEYIAVGQVMNLGLKQDGTIWGWGANYYGQLGDGTIIDRTGPVRIGTSHDWKAIFPGTNQSFAIKKDGTLWSWGDNTEGELGDGTWLPKMTPIQVGTANNWKFISPGFNHILALKADGSLWTWGDNAFGQLGDSRPLNEMNSPKQIGTDKDWIFIEAGYSSSFALKADGSLYGWGDNLDGELGVNNLRERFFPDKITNYKWKTVAGGQGHVLAIRNDSTLWSWGWNGRGQLGNGTTNSSNIPNQVGTASNWVSISAGNAHSMAMKKDGSLWVWGNNFFGQVGDGTTIDRLTPYLLPCNLSDGIVVLQKPGIVVPDDDLTYYVPDAFTPNADGLNDVFNINGKHILKMHFEIYNRWGEKIAVLEDLTTGWNGEYQEKPCPEGIYFYCLEVKGLIDNSVKTTYKSGTFTLIR